MSEGQAGDTCALQAVLFRMSGEVNFQMRAPLAGRVLLG